jgi:hypothetical protein
MTIETAPQPSDWEALIADTDELRAQLEQKTEQELALEDMQARLFDRIAANASVIDQHALLGPARNPDYKPALGTLVKSIRLDLEDQYWKCRSFYPPIPHDLIRQFPERFPDLVQALEQIRSHRRGKSRDIDPLDDFLVYLWAEDPLTHLAALVQPGFDYPLRPHILALHYQHPQPDLFVSVLTMPPKSTKPDPRLSKPTYELSLAKAVKDVQLPLRIYHLLDLWRVEPYPHHPVIMDNPIRDEVLRREERRRQKEKEAKQAQHGA